MGAVASGFRIPWAIVKPIYSTEVSCRWDTVIPNSNDTKISAYIHHGVSNLVR